MLHVVLTSSYGAGFAPLSDPAGASVFVAALAWLEGTLLGTIATTVAIIAVSWIGLMMLAGRVNVHHGLTVIAGCFIIFGASTIAAGIRAAAEGASLAAAPPPPPPSSAPALPSPPANRDPYAGASVPSP